MTETKINDSSNPADDHRRWEQEVRDPAQDATEGAQTIRVGRSTAEYELAPIPNGWAHRSHAESPGDYSYSGTPWIGPVPTRDEALTAALDHMAWLYERQHGDTDEADRMLAKIDRLRVQPDLFGVQP